MIHWYALRTTPVHRIEFDVMRKLNQLEHQALVPFETKWIKRPDKKFVIERKYPYFPSLVFVALSSMEEYHYLKDKIDDVKGLLGFTPGVPAKIRDGDLDRIKTLSVEAPTTEIDLHKAYQVGKAVSVSIGGLTQPTKINALTKRGIEAMVQMFGTMILVEVPFDKVRAA